MKVMHVVTSLVRGGAETHVVDLAKGEVDRGVGVTVAYLKDEDYWSDALVEANVATVPLSMAKYGDPRPIVRLRAAMRRIQPDVLHAHLPPAELYSRLALAAGAPARTFVITRHNDEGFYHGPWHREIGAWVARRADTVIAVSETVRDQTHRYLDLSPAKTRAIQHGIDLEPFARVKVTERNRLRAEWGAANNATVIGTVGRLVPQKAVHILLESFARFRSLTSRPSRLVIVGSGPLETELKTRSLELGLADAVVWAGFRHDIPAVMSSFDIFALSSRYEGFGIVLLEAMAAGKPVVATNVSAIPELVEDGMAGLLSPVDDPCAFGTALLRLENKPMREKLGTAGRKLAGQFTMDRMIDSTLAVYTGALNVPR